MAHTFLVQNLKQELQKYTDDIKVNIVEDVDIQTKTPHFGEIAFEIETGLSYQKNPKELKQKFERLLLNRTKMVIVVLTDKKYRTQYENIHPELKVVTRNQIPDLLTFLFKPTKKKKSKK